MIKRKVGKIKEKLVVSGGKLEYTYYVFLYSDENNIS